MYSISWKKFAGKLQRTTGGIVQENKTQWTCCQGVQVLRTLQTKQSGGNDLNFYTSRRQNGQQASQPILEMKKRLKKLQRIELISLIPW